jgi:ABC-type amino acid transport substrate-binding protein
MADEKRLTLFGKLVVFAFIAGCAWYALKLWPGNPVRGVVDSVKRGVDATKTATRAPERPAAPAAAPGKPATLRRGVLAEMRRRGAVRIGYEPNAPPMFFKSAQTGDDGFEYQLARRLSAELGLSAPGPLFVAGDYQSLPERLQRGDVDLILAGYVPDPSLEGVEWSDGYLDFGLCLIVLRSSAITEVGQLAGKTVAIYDDPAAERWVKQHVPGARVRAYAGDAGWFEALESREVDALIYDYPFAAEEIRRHPRTKIVQFNLNQSRYAVGVPAGNDDLLDAVNAALRRIKASPEYGELVRRYLSYQSEDVIKPIAGRRTYTVRPGDTLSTIARGQLGAVERWEEIWDLNRDRIANPHLIYPEYVLLMP